MPETCVVHLLVLYTAADLKLRAVASPLWLTIFDPTIFLPVRSAKLENLSTCAAYIHGKRVKAQTLTRAINSCAPACLSSQLNSVAKKVLTHQTRRHWLPSSQGMWCLQLPRKSQAAAHASSSCTREGPKP